MQVLCKPEKRIITRLFLILFTLFLILLLTLNNALAHEIRPAIIDLNLYQSSHQQQQKMPATFKVSIKLNLEALIAQVSTEKNSNDSANADFYNALRELPAEELAQKFLGFEKNFLNKIHLSFDNKDYPLTVKNLDIPPVGDLDLARDSIIYLEGTIPEGSKNIRWRWDASFGNAALRVNIVDNSAGNTTENAAADSSELHSSYLLDGQASEVIYFNAKNTPDEIKNSKKQGGWVLQWKTFKNYIQVGYVHIVPKGIDHILFVIGLFLLSANLRPLLIQITSFTIAHSVTLALGIYGIINVPPSIVEPLIAASIVYVAIENIYSSKLNPWRPVIVFLFGLLHGLGFASVLTEIGLSENYYATGLIAFNLGVELGQLSVILACFLLVGIWFRNKPWYRQRITIPASLMIAVIACYWFAERVGWV